MDMLPEATALLQALAPAFSQPTWRRAQVLLAAAILCRGRHTVDNLLRSVGTLAEGDTSGYRRVLSAAGWSALQVSRRLAGLIIALTRPDEAVVLVGDDTVTEHRGRCVHGKGRHRDAVRSAHSYTAFKYGHCWVVLAILMKLPGTSRRWALPIMIELYRTAAGDEAAGRRHRTQAELMQSMLMRLTHWFPTRNFIFVGDGGYSTRKLARFVDIRKNLQMVGKLPKDAQLYAPAPPYSGRGRPRVKGEKLPTPQEGMEQAQTDNTMTPLEVDWYGGGTRKVKVASGSGGWHESGHGMVHVRWVWTEDVSGTHRAEVFLTTDDTLTAAQIISLYCGRWNIEVTFQECRAYLGLDQTRGWCRNTVLRAEPALFGLYSIVAWLWQALPENERVRHVDWPGKTELAFADALTCVRRRLWLDWVLPQAGLAGPFTKLPATSRDAFLASLSLAT